MSGKSAALAPLMLSNFKEALELSTMGCKNISPVFSARQQAERARAYAIARPSICPSVTRVDQSKCGCIDYASFTNSPYSSLPPGRNFGQKSGGTIPFPSPSLSPSPLSPLPFSTS